MLDSLNWLMAQSLCNIMGYIVYCHENMANGKRYFGITKQHPEKRWRNGYGYKTQPYFYSAIQKYGWDGFEHKILASNLTEKSAKDLEVKLIKHYQSNYRKYGYNITNGGEGSSGHKFIATPETRQKMSESHIGLFSGDKHPMYGKHHSEEAKRKQSLANKGKVIPPDVIKRRVQSNKTRTPVAQLDKDTGEVINVYVSLNYAAKEVNTSAGNIHGVLNGRGKTAGGYKWKYVERSETDEYFSSINYG